MNGINLSIRHFEHMRFYKSWQGVAATDLYAVALVEAPRLPGERKYHHPECFPLAVVCAAVYPNPGGEHPDELLWGWVHPDQETSKAIGDGLSSMKAEVGKWYYLIISSSGVTKCELPFLDE